MKNTYIHVRLTDQQLVKAKYNAERLSMTLSEYTRHSICDTDPETATALAKAVKLLREVVLELKRQGTNLNQITKMANTYKQDDFSKQISRTIKDNTSLLNTIYDWLALTKKIVK